MADIDAGTSTDPDAQATVTDFLDYTEYLPSDILRSLTLIRGLDETYQSKSYNVHELTRQYGAFPKLSAIARPDSQVLRTQISIHLDSALNARESSYAEACRLFDVADRHYNRLNSIINKLHALPKPPSRDPTPQISKSPVDVKRSRSGRKIEYGTSIPRLTLNPPRAPTAATSIVPKPRSRRITVPGEVLPAYNPDSPIVSTEVTDWESDEPSPVRSTIKLKQPKPQKITLSPALKPRERRGSSIPYRKPTPPPEDAELGGKHRPWTRLTEWEMYKLRKKMKKNHTWDPSDVMIKRTLESKGRGWDNYIAAKVEAQKHGTKFLDDDNLDQSRSKVDKEILSTPVEEKTLQLKKADPRKPKMDTQAREQTARAAQEAELAARRLGDIGSAFKNLFSPFSNALASLQRSASSPTTNGKDTTGRKAANKPSKKRKLEEIDVPTPSPSIEVEPSKKKQRTAPLTSPLPAAESPAPPTIKIPLKIRLPVSGAATPTTVATRASRRSSAAPKTESTPPPSTRPPSRLSTAASVEPAAAIVRSSRRTSTPATAIRARSILENSPRETAASRRTRREAPGTVTQSSQDGGAAVSISMRRTKPTKQTKATSTPKAEDRSTPEIRVDVDGKQEVLNPHEERYCICGDVSWGEMICCELDEKCEHGQWFHMECIHLHELPPRTVKWYCPGDRKKLKRGENTNGLVGRGIK